jgi:hypothetical protein
LDAADDRPHEWTWHDLVIDAVRGGNAAEGMKGETLGLTSVQAERMLCPACTTAVYGAITDDRDATSAEIDAILAA